MDRSEILEKLERGEITAEEALKSLKPFQAVKKREGSETRSRLLRVFKISVKDKEHRINIPIPLALFMPIAYVAAAVVYALPNEVFLKVLEEAKQKGRTGKSIDKRKENVDENKFHYERDMEIQKIKNAVVKALMFVAHDLDGSLVEVNDGEDTVRIGIY